MSRLRFFMTKMPILNAAASGRGPTATNGGMGFGEPADRDVVADLARAFGMRASFRPDGQSQIGLLARVNRLAIMKCVVQIVCHHANLRVVGLSEKGRR